MIRTPDGQLYSRSSLAYSVWERYLKHFDHLTVTTRLSECECLDENLVLSSGPRVSFAGVPDDHGKLLQQLRIRPALRIIRKEIQNCDAVIARSSAIGWLAAHEAEKRDIPWAVEVVGNPWDAFWNYGTIAGKLYAPIAWSQARRWIRRAPFAIYVTKQYLQGRFPNNNHAEYASNVQIHPVNPSVLKARLASTNAWQRDDRLVIKCGLIGHLYAKYKGLLIALKALKTLRWHSIHVHLHVLGAGQHDVWMREAARLGVQDLLHLDGVLPAGEAVFQWLDRLDMYIQPSLTEGLPRALIEAMSRGLPALASTCGGIPELLPAECLHPPGNYSKLAEDMQHMITDRMWRAQMSQRNFNEAMQYCTDVVSERRDAFWARFAEHAGSIQRKRG